MHDRRETNVAVPTGKNTKNVSFSTCQNMCLCCFAWQARHFVTFDVFQEECVCATIVRLQLLCLWGKPQKTYLSCQKLWSCRFAWQSGTLHSTVHSTLETRTLHSTLHTLHSTFYTPHFTLYTPHSTISTQHLTLHTLHS